MASSRRLGSLPLDRQTLDDCFPSLSKDCVFSKVSDWTAQLAPRVVVLPHVLVAHSWGQVIQAGAISAASTCQQPISLWVCAHDRAPIVPAPHTTRIHGLEIGGNHWGGISATARHWTTQPLAPIGIRWARSRNAERWQSGGVGCLRTDRLGIRRDWERVVCFVEWLIKSRRRVGPYCKGLTVSGVFR